MKRVFLLLVPLLLLPLVCLAAEGGRWRPLGVFDVSWGQGLETRVFTDHQGDHYMTVCRAYLDEGELGIIFPMEESYPLGVALTVRGAQYQGTVWWLSDTGVMVPGAIASSELVLDKKSYEAGEKLKGHVSLAFTTREAAAAQEEDGPRKSYVVHGPFSAIVRPLGFDPWADENVVGYSHDVAVYELGPARDVGELLFDADQDYTRTDLCALPRGEFSLSVRDRAGLDAARADFLADHPQPPGSALRELTWLPERSQTSGERLTVWFVKARKGGDYASAGFRRWKP